MRKTGILILLSVLFFLVACNDSPPDNSTDSSGTQAQAQNENTQTSPHAQDGNIIEENKNIIGSYSVKRAAEIYIEAANKVKEEAAGFTKSEWQSIKNIKTADTSGLADRILDIVFTNIITSEDAAFGSEARLVTKGSSDRVNLLFPIYNKPYGADLNMNYDCISSAEYKKEDGKYKINLYFKELENAEQDDGGFGSIMPVFKRAEILDNIRRYVLVADLETLALDFSYKNSYLSCVIDAQTMQMEGLDMHIKADLEASADINVLGIIKTDFLSGTATVENNIRFYNFEW